MGFIVRIPFDPKEASAQPLKKCLNAAAQANGVTDFIVAYIMSDFLTELAAQVASGKIVHIPGFGKYGACTRGLKHSYASPRFYSSNAFSQEVRATCSLKKAEKNTESIKLYGKRNRPTSRTDKQHCRVFTAMDSFKKDLQKQERKLGLRG